MTLPALELPELGLGGGPLGNLFHRISDEQARETVDAAWDAGIRYYDTAPPYGLGLSEQRLGAALRDRPRADYLLSTKVGRVLVPNPPGPHPRDADIFDVPATHRRVWDLSRDGVLRSPDDSLHRLDLDHVDLLLLHEPVQHWRQALDEAYPTMAGLRGEGVVRAIGFGMSQVDLIADAVRETDLDVVMLAGGCTLLEQPAAPELLPLCAERGVAVVAVALFHSGLLAGAPAPGTAEPEHLRRAERLAAVCQRHGVPLAAAAMRYPLRHPAIRSIVIGCHTAEQVRHDTALFNQPIPAALWEELRAEGPAAP